MSETKLDDLSLDEALDARTALIALQRSDGWAILVKIWQQDLQQQRNAFAGPIKSDFELYAQEWTKGAVAQIESDLRLPAMLIDNLNHQIDTHPRNKESSNVSSAEVPLDDDPAESGSAGLEPNTGRVP